MMYNRNRGTSISVIKLIIKIPLSYQNHKFMFSSGQEMVKIAKFWPVRHNN